jgi:uncharacterized membrane protein
MTLGPIDFIVLEFPGNKFKGEILPSIFELVEQGIVRVIDLVIILKDGDGAVVVRELQELDADSVAIFNPLKAEVSQMLTNGDIDNISAQLANNSTAGLMLIENLWAKKVKQAMENANGKLVMFERIPHDVVDEALADIAALAASQG